MKRIIVLIAILAVQFSVQASDNAENVKFSKHSSLLEFHSYNKQTKTHKFLGKIKITGTLFLIFDMETPNKASDKINFTKFVPDEKSVDLLPAVVKGFYTGGVKYVNLDAPHEQIVKLFGGVEKYKQLSHGPEHEVSEKAEVVLDSYSATIECDSRVYWGHVVTINPQLKEQQMVSKESAPNGC